MFGFEFDGRYRHNKALEWILNALFPIGGITGKQNIRCNAEIRFTTLLYKKILNKTCQIYYRR